MYNLHIQNNGYLLQLSIILRDSATAEKLPAVLIKDILVVLMEAQAVLFPGVKSLYRQRTTSLLRT